MALILKVRVELLERIPVDEMCPVCSTWAIERFALAFDVGGVLKLRVTQECVRCRKDARDG